MAQELAKWGETQPGGEAIHDALFRAYFVDGRNIGHPDDLVEIAAGIGLNDAEARHVLRERRFREAVDDDWLRSRTLGITGVPTFVVGDRGVVGAQPYAVLEQLVQAGGAQRRR